MQFLTDINTTLTDTLGPFGPLLVVGVLGMFLILLTLPVLLKKQEDPLDKLKRNNVTPGQRDSLRFNQGTDKLDKYADFLEPQDEEEYSAIRLKLLQAGYRGKSAVRTFHFAQFALGIALLLAGVALRNLQLDRRRAIDPIDHHVDSHSGVCWVYGSQVLGDKAPANAPRGDHKWLSRQSRHDACVC